MNPKKGKSCVKDAFASGGGCAASESSLALDLCFVAARREGQGVRRNKRVLLAIPDRSNRTNKTNNEEQAE